LNAWLASLCALAWLIPPDPSLNSVAVAWICTVVCLAFALLRWSFAPAMPLAAPTCQAAMMRRSWWVLGCLVGAGLNASLALVQWLGLGVWMPSGVVASTAGQAQGQLMQRNLLASLMMLGAWMWLMRPWRYTASKARTLRFEATWTLAKRTAFWAGLALAAAVLALTASRTGALQWLGLGLLLLLWRIPPWGRAAPLAQARRAWLGLGTVYAALGLALLLNYGGGLLGRWDDDNALSRLALWRNTLELVAQSPGVGHGWRSLAYLHYRSDFSGARFMEMVDNAHCLPLHLAVELGIPVALAWCSLVLWLIYKGKPWAESRPDRQLAWGVLLLLGIHSMVEYPLWYGPFFLMALMAIGLLCAEAWHQWWQARPAWVQRLVRHIACALALVLLAGAAHAAFDYHRVRQIYLPPEQRSAWYSADPLGAAQKSVWFQNHAQFAQLQLTVLSVETAPRVLALSQALVRWSPEPRTIEKLIASAQMLQADELAAFHRQRYQTAYPEAYARWSAHNTLGVSRRITGSFFE
jgi:O-antigen polymerase